MATKNGWLGRSAACAAAGVAAVLGCVGVATAQPLGGTTIVGSGLALPLYVIAPTGDTARIFVMEQRYRTASNQPWYGRIRTVQLSNNAIQPTTAAFFDMRLATTPIAVAGADEQGLLGLAFHPNFATNGYFYVNYTRASDGATVVARFRTIGGSPTANADMNSQQIILTIPQPANNHNGGWISFGPDGLLYIATGDGGGGNDNQPPFNTTTGNAQNLSSLLGKMLRIDVDGPDNIPANADDGTVGNPARAFYRIPADNPFAGAIPGEDEILHFGLRNPWRCSFDRETGELYIADVGQGVREEVHVVPSTARGVNFGWRCFEGTRVTGLGGCNPLPSSAVAPIFEYGHTTPVGPTTLLGCSITGGYVYRGSAMPWLRGSYFFADYCTQSTFSWRKCGDQLLQVTDWTTQVDPDAIGSGLEINNITSFGEDALGELYITDRSGGQVFKIVPEGPQPTTIDCNANGVPDDCDIAAGTAVDANTNGIPDSCEPSCPACPADFDQDGGVTGADVESFFSAFEAGEPCGDTDGDGGVTGADVEAFFAAFEAGGC
jgi:glucose/arabinose dehydrogenase